MLVRELEKGNCPTCGAAVGMGLKEESGGWKVYRVCLADQGRCQAGKVGSVPRSSVDHFDEMVDQATTMIEQTTF